VPLQRLHLKLRFGDTDASHVWAVTFRDAGVNAEAQEELPFCASLGGDISP